MKQTHLSVVVFHGWILILAAAVGHSVQAQTEFGVKAGVNADYIKTNGQVTGSGTHSSANLGFHAGLFGRLAFSERWSFIGEVQYIRKGTRSISPQLPTMQGSYFEYFNISLLPAYGFTDFLSVEAGPSFDFQTRLFRSESSLSPDDLVHFGFNVGLRLRVSDRLILNTRYHHALTPFDTHMWTSSAGGTSQYFYRTVQLGAAYVFRKEE